MGLLLCAVLVLVLLPFGGGQQGTAGLVRGVLPCIGTLLLVACVPLVAGLSLPATRCLAQVVLVATITGLVVVGRASLQITLAVCRVLWTSGPAACPCLWGEMP
ncbi:MAG: hypothetical protein ABSD47_10220 [Candidatus Methylomirabilota bacterium]|jgi:hypothetical protein